MSSGGSERKDAMNAVLAKSFATSTTTSDLAATWRQGGGARQMILVLGSGLAAAALVAPTFFTCRHTYEAVLQDELAQHALDTTSPLPGLVRVAGDVPDGLDPVYALQMLPSAVEVRAPSVKSLSNAVVDALLQTCLLYTSPSPRDRQKSRMPSSA